MFENGLGQDLTIVSLSHIFNMQAVLIALKYIFYSQEFRKTWMT